jgi:uncharacterized protein (DUF2237 family)
MIKASDKNVLGGDLMRHCLSPKIGFYRDGFCRTGDADVGRHLIAAIVTQAFLDFTQSQGNDLQTTQPFYDFPGLKAGDRWCLCAIRWLEAHEAGCAPPLVLEATHEKALDYVSLEILKKYKA